MPYKDPSAKRAYDAKRRAKDPDKYRQYSKDYYVANREKRIAYMDQLAAARLAKLREIVMEVKAKPCMDCEQCFHFSAMDFDHRPGEVKRQDINRIMRSRYTSEHYLREEMAKCDLVCSNCHRVRTYNRRHEDDMETTG